MSVEEMFEWEKRTHRGFFLPWYARNDFTVVEDYVGSKTPYDVVIERDGQVFRVDEKAGRYVRKVFYGEWVQCLKRGSMGWVHKDFDVLLWAQFPGPDSDPSQPSTLDWVLKPPLKDFLLSFVPEQLRPQVQLYINRMMLDGELNLMGALKALFATGSSMPVQPAITTFEWGMTLNMVTRWDAADGVISERLLGPEMRKPPGAPGASLHTGGVAVSTNRGDTVPQSPGSPQPPVDGQLPFAV